MQIAKSIVLLLLWTSRVRFSRISEEPSPNLTSLTSRYPAKQHERHCKPPRNSMEGAIKVKDDIEQLYIAIEAFIDTELPHATYKAPIIDHWHPTEYEQKTIAGLSKFQALVAAERDHVTAVCSTDRE